MKTIQFECGGISASLLAFARTFALAGVMALTACGGGGTDAPAVPVDTRETSVTATQSFRWTGGPGGHSNSPTHGHLKFPHPDRASMRH